jgi:hypothetical protein
MNMNTNIIEKELTKSKRKGSAPLVMLVIAVLLVTGVGLLGLGLESRILAIRDTAGITARCAADSGLTKAVHEMNQKLQLKPWNDGDLPQAINETLPGCDATFSYTITGDSVNGYTVEATGKSLEAEKTVNCNLGLKGRFDYAILTQTDIALKSGGTVDWYNYDANDRIFSIGTNSTEEGAINLKHGATVNGNVIVGPGADPDTVIDDLGATITGETYAATETYSFPPATVPAALYGEPSQGALDDSAVITASGKYDSINLGNSEILTIDGDVSLYITGDVTLGNSAELQIVDAGTNPNASLTLYVEGDVEVKTGGALNNLAQDPKKLKIFGLDSCQNIILKNSSDFYGTIYAPNAYVEMKNSASAYGAVVADSFEQKNSAAFYYDASLRDVDIEEAERFIVMHWSEH